MEKKLLYSEGSGFHPNTEYDESLYEEKLVTKTASTTLGILKMNGTLESCSTRSATDFIELGKTIKFKAFQAVAAYAAYCFYKADKTFLSRVQGASYGAESEYELSETDYPAGAKYIRFTSSSKNATASYSGTYKMFVIDILKDEIEETNKVAALSKEMLGDKKILTAVGSSAFDLRSGGQWSLTDAQKTTYGVTSDLTITRVLQKLLGYDVANICAWAGRTSSAIAWINGICPFKYNNAVTLKKDKSWVSIDWDTTAVNVLMTANPLSVYRIQEQSAFFGGYKVVLDAYNKRVKLDQDVDKDIPLKAGSMIYGVPKLRDDSAASGAVTLGVRNSTGLIIQYGGNGDGVTANELIQYCELTIKESGCRWFICVPANSRGCDLYTHTDALKAHFGSRFIDYFEYICTAQAIRDQGLTPTTSDTYPDEEGNNSNPLTATQIANGVTCDFEQISKKELPSSFWHSAFREGEEQAKNVGHLNAQGLEAVGKFLYKMIKALNIA